MLHRIHTRASGCILAACTCSRDTTYPTCKRLHTHHARSRPAAAHLQACEEQMLTCLTADAFGETGREAMDISLYKQKDAVERDAAFLREVGWRCAALEACRSWLLGYVSVLPSGSRRLALCAAVSTSLRPLLTLVCSSPALQDPAKVCFWYQASS